MHTRREFLRRGTRLGLAAATSSLWGTSRGLRAFAQAPTSAYKAVVVVTMTGGNDGNNMIVPMNAAEYNQYASVRKNLALSRSALNPLSGSSGLPSYGLHPSLRNIAAMYNAKQAVAIANVGPLARPVTKDQLLANASLRPAELFDHVAGFQQWESAQTIAPPTTGWGGRVGDYIVGQSGALPPVLNGGGESIFTVGNTVQGVCVQTGSAWPALLPGMNEVIQNIAQSDSSSANRLVAATAKLRSASMQQQVLIDQAMSYGTLKTQFNGSTTFGQTMRTIASIINGRSVIGATRQIFYVQQGAYDTHASQLDGQSASLNDLDNVIGSFMAALDEMGLTDQVLVCTHSDFCRTVTPNTNGGTDHAWGNHQLMLGGGINGGRIIGTMPDFELGGSTDFNGLGVWIPTLSVTQMTAAIAAWLGLNNSQIASVFPDLPNFTSGAVSL